MARMMSIRLVGQMSSVARCDDDGWVHWGMGMRGAIGCDGVAGVGVGVGVVVTVIVCDGCGNVGDGCHWGVDVSLLWGRGSAGGCAYWYALLLGSVVIVGGGVTCVVADVVVQRSPSNSKL